jgi:hypothetical protein
MTQGLYLRDFLVKPIQRTLSKRFTPCQYHHDDDNNRR